MTVPLVDHRTERILVLKPSNAEIASVLSLLSQAEIPFHLCFTIEEFCHEFKEGAGGAFLAEEELDSLLMNRLVVLLEHQPTWSDFPLVVSFRQSSESPETSLRMLQMLEPLRNVTLLDRPLRVMTLVSILRTAIHARRRQYEIRDLIHNLDNSVQRRDELLAHLAHELRNPLGTIRNSVQILDQYGSRDANALRQRTIINRQTRKLARIIDELLDVFRVTSGKLTLQHLPVDLKKLIARCLQNMDQAVSDAAISLSLEDNAETLIVEGDLLRLEQMVTHLFENAVKFTPPGGRIWVRLGRDGMNAVLRIRDTGVGIEPGLLPRIFHLFSGTTNFIQRPQGGLGIGLAIVRGLVEMHKGKVTAFSAGRDLGSEFVVSLPLRQEAKLPAPQVKRDFPDYSSRRILIIEDNADGRETLKIMLELWGHRPEVAVDGLHGVQQALDTRPEIALVDIGLPGIDGYQVAEKVRASLGTQPLLIAMTGYGQPHDKRRALEAGFDAHLVKPIDPEILRDLLVHLEHR